MSSLLPRVVEGAAHGAARVRRARAVHARGRTFHATVRGAGPGRGIPPLDTAQPRRALVRFSRGAGLPDGWPDVLGLAVRVFDAGGCGVDVDLLFSTASTGPVGRHVPLPAWDLAGPYTTIAGYDTAHGRRQLAVRADPEGTPPGRRLSGLRPGAVFQFATAAPLGRWRAAGRLVVGAPVPADVDAALAFDPTLHDLPDLRAAGYLQRLRRAAYRGSRRSRGGLLLTRGDDDTAAR
ncbi:MAG TPA: phosphodiesterase [Pilimelia sp.]|nr:phosphodiesterase [Pilimelia sp.]